MRQSDRPQPPLCSQPRTETPAQPYLSSDRNDATMNTQNMTASNTTDTMSGMNAMNEMNARNVVNVMNTTSNSTNLNHGHNSNNSSNGINHNNTDTTTMNQKNEANAKNKNGLPSSVSNACVFCRQKHLKCDGKTPCERCISNGVAVDCSYVPSRRGVRPPRAVPAPRNSHKRQATEAADYVSSLDSLPTTAQQVPPTTQTGPSPLENPFAGINIPNTSCPMLLGARSGPTLMTPASYSMAQSPQSALALHEQLRQPQQPHLQSQQQQLQPHFTSQQPPQPPRQSRQHPQSHLQQQQQQQLQLQLQYHGTGNLSLMDINMAYTSPGLSGLSNSSSSSSLADSRFSGPGHSSFSDSSLSPHSYQQALFDTTSASSGSLASGSSDPLAPSPSPGPSVSSQPFCSTDHLLIPYPNLATAKSTNTDQTDSQQTQQQTLGPDFSAIWKNMPGGLQTYLMNNEAVEVQCRQKALDSFYNNFHAAHPFVLPRPFLTEHVDEASRKILLTAMLWVGSLYLPRHPHGLQDKLLDEAQTAIRSATTVAEESLQDEGSSSNDKGNGWLVQSLLLLIIGLDGSCNQPEARELLAKVENLALSIGLNSQEFSHKHGGSSELLRECWRRTWWELYVVDGMIAGVHQQTNFDLFDVSSDVGLPCEEEDYVRGTQIPSPPMSLEDLEDIELSGSDAQGSSFGYRVLAARTLGKFMRMMMSGGMDDRKVDRVEIMLTNWRMHLPPAKKDSLTKDGLLDEMMFQAYMITHATSIMLHQPHSFLDTSVAKEIESCAPYKKAITGHHFNIHTNHTLTSASEVCKMITHRAPMLSHSHFFTCVLTLASIVLLSKWAVFTITLDDEDGHLREDVRLNIGALKKLSEVWRAANTASGQIKAVAQEVYQIKKKQQSLPNFFHGMTQEEAAKTLTADDAIFSDFQALQA